MTRKEQIQRAASGVADFQCMQYFILGATNVWCNYDGCDSPQVNVSLDLCGEEIHRSSDYLLRVN